jgi:hypothetical protein
VDHGDVKKLTIVTGCFAAAVTGTLAARIHRFDADAAVLLRPLPRPAAPEDAPSHDWSLWEQELQTGSPGRSTHER